MVPHRVKFTHSYSLYRGCITVTSTPLSSYLILCFVLLVNAAPCCIWYVIAIEPSITGPIMIGDKSHMESIDHRIFVSAAHNIGRLDWA